MEAIKGFVHVAHMIMLGRLKISCKRKLIIGILIMN